MKRLIGLLFLLAAAVGAAMLMELTWGNVTLWLPPYRVDMSLQAAIIFLLLALAATLLIARLLSAVMGIPERVRRYRQRRLQEERLRTLSSLIVAFFQGRFARVVKSSRALQSDASLKKDIPQAAVATIAMAATAAHRMRDIALRDQLIADLRDAMPSRDAHDQALAALLQAEFALDDHRGAQALAALAPLTRGDRRHIHTLRLALRANHQQSNWPEVLRLARLLENRKALSSVAAAQYKRSVAQAWMKADRHLDAIELIESSLKSHWDSGLAMLYGRCEGDAKHQLAKLEEWLQRHPQDAELNWSLGRICQREKLWGKARMHLEMSLRAKPMVATHLALAEIAETLSEKETAASHWKAAAQLTI